MEEEVSIINGHHSRRGVKPMLEVNTVLTGADIVTYRNTVQQIHVEQHLLLYIAQLIQETRNSASLFLGASPRASIAILNSAKAYAAINGRDFVTPEDIKMLRCRC